MTVELEWIDIKTQLPVFKEYGCDAISILINYEYEGKFVVQEARPILRQENYYFFLGYEPAGDNNGIVKLEEVTHWAELPQSIERISL
jgi:hypothetical protein